MTFKKFKGIDLTILKIVGIYALFGGLWIYASDTIFAWLVIDPEILKTISIFKGLLFIALTSSLLFLLIVRYFTERMRVEQALQQEHKLYEDLVNTLPAGVYRLRVKSRGNWSTVTWQGMYEAQYAIDFASDHFCDIMGISHDAILANHSVVLDSIYYDDKEDFNARNAQAMTDLDPFLWEGRIIRNKQTRWVHFESLPRVIDSDTVLWTGIVYDITERKQVEESLREVEEQHRVIFDTSQAGIILVGPQGAILFANNRMAEIFGMPLVELTGSSYSEHLHPAERKTGDELMQQLIRGDIKSVSDERHYIRANGSDFWGYLSGKRLENPDGTLRALVGIIADITEQNSARTELKRKNAEIEQFLYTVSHDLRSPLVTVKTFMGFLEQDMSASDNERIAKDIVFINSAADRMESLLNELLEISKVGKPEALNVSITFKELIAEALDSVSGQIATNKVNVMIA